MSHMYVDWPIGSGAGGEAGRKSDVNQSEAGRTPAGLVKAGCSEIQTHTCNDRVTLIVTQS